MSLNKAQLKSRIVTILKELSKREDDPEKAVDDFAEAIANAVDSYVKSGTFFATPVQITSAALSNGGGPVVAANNLNITIT